MSSIATTQWSQVLAARDGSASEARAALEKLCGTYWRPLFAFVRAQGHDPEEARDLTQGYFAELLAKDVLAQVDPEKGRFRSFLLASMRNYLAHQRDRERALKRGGGLIGLSLDVEEGERNYTAEPANEVTPEDLFDRRWAMTVLDRALERLERVSDPAAFEAMRPHLTGEGREERYRQIAERLDMTEGAVKTAVHRLRRRFGDCLRAEIAETVADGSDVDDEVRYLLSVVRTP
jgi:RNA polymerase sigma factor (sigma-70 family)